MTLADWSLSKKIDLITRSMRQVWDPIGGGGISELPDDEYASYAPVIVAMFLRGASDHEVALQLQRIEEDQLKVQGADVQQLTSVARALRNTIESP